MSPNLEVANEVLREKVKAIRKDGFPKELTFEEAQSKFSNEQLKIVHDLVNAAGEEEKIAKAGGEPKKGNKRWKTREKIRELIQTAIANDMIGIGIIQRHAVGYGAIPDPDEDWKYYKLPDGTYACWNCGGEILGKNVAFSVHFAEFRCAGGGEVRNKVVPYCPKCEKEPPDSGIIRETIGESLQREFR